LLKDNIIVKPYPCQERGIAVKVRGDSRRKFGHVIDPFLRDCAQAMYVESNVACDSFAFMPRGNPVRVELRGEGDIVSRQSFEADLKVVLLKVTRL
jgi:hypothetical protein